MINRIHQAFYRPEKGWDPVPDSHARTYAEHAWQHLLDPGVIVWIESLLGPVAGKAILDLGAGPGQYSIEFARRGANVTWHDVSSRYESITRRRAEEAGVAVSFSLGYMESAGRLGYGRFDLVFCRSCWLYSVSDRPFANLVYRLVKPGGCAFINTSLSGTMPRSLSRQIQRFLYERLHYKIGHPMPPPGRIAGLFAEFDTTAFQTRRYPDQNEEEVLFQKPPGVARK